MEKLRVNLFGKLTVAFESGIYIEIEGRKAQELFCFLLLFRQQPHSRDVLSDALWRDHTGDQSRTYLRRTLWHLQNSFAEYSDVFEHPLLLVEPDWLQLNPLAGLSIDVAEFEEAYKFARGTAGENLDQQIWRRLRLAADLYKGNLLEGCYHNWCVWERERLQNIYLVILDKMMRYCKVHSRFEEGIDYGMRILRQDPARENTHRQLMHLYLLNRDRSSALHQYEKCLKILKKELEVEPTRRTKRLFLKIKEDSSDLITSPIQTETVLDASAIDLNFRQEVLHELQRVRTDVSRLGRRLDLQIETIRKSLYQ